ncbi:hypothetical protein WBQ88_19725 [Sphingopyxis sp. CCNWLW253]|uniref:hypothetical protein n=1 Tax=unclassified Sphingopyxis TaxID=2614943 RepID=UPI003012E194
MKYSMIAALLVAGTTTATFYPAAAQAGEGCAAQTAKKKRGVGLQLARGLKGSIEGALRGDGDLGSDLQGTAGQAAERSSRDAQGAAECDKAPPRESASNASAPETATQRAQRKMAASDAKYPSRMTIPDDWKTAKAAYDEFGKVKCMSCEGGYGYSGWPDWPRDEFSGKYNGTEKRLSQFPVGHVYRWSSNGFAGTLTVDGEEQVNGFRCRKMTYRLEKGGKSAARPSLICWGKANEYAGSDSWVGVF